MTPSTPQLRSGRADDRLAALFDDSTRDSDQPTHWWQRKRGRIALAIGAALVLTVAVATQAFGAAGNEYRTATVEDRNVDALLSSAATVEPVSQATVAFPVSGTVASVGVKVGDTVSVGQTLATLDPQTLTDTLHERQAALAQAQLSLEQALAGESVTTSPGSGGSGSSPSASGANTSADASSASLLSTSTGAREIQLISATTSVRAASTDPDIAAAQQAVLQAQQAVDVALGVAADALTNATTVCAAIGSDPNTPPTIEQVAACQTAITEALDAQTAVQTAQNALVDASNALDALLEQRANTSTTPSTNPDAGGTGGASDTGGLGGPSASPGGGGSSPSSADLIAYQKAIDAAAAEVAVAEQALAQASIASPIDGTVVSVTVEVGESVESGSTTASIVVQGPGGYEISTTVGVDRVSDVEVGQRATFTPDGTHKLLEGKVAYLSAVPSSTSSTTSYLVVVGLTNSKADLNNGSTGTVRIVTESAKAALAVPTSAVTTNGARHSVEVADGDGTRRVFVDVGVVGDTWTEITSGIDAGDEVVLADLSEPLPGSATDSSTSSQGGFPGGGTFPAGGPVRIGPGR